ncbi:MAG: SRPBCC family protein [Thermoleophilaceae bacterium]
MSDRSVKHGTFQIERSYEAPPDQVFTAWADPEAKGRWFGTGEPAELDFRVGGREHSEGTGPNGSSYRYDALYQDIVPAERIVYTYDMHLDGERISVSVATVEFEASETGTRLVYTEQGAYLDGLDEPEMRQGGTGTMLDKLGTLFAAERTGA